MKENKEKTITIRDVLVYDRSDWELMSKKYISDFDSFKVVFKNKITGEQENFLTSVRYYEKTDRQGESGNYKKPEIVKKSKKDSISSVYKSILSKRKKIGNLLEDIDKELEKLKKLNPDL